ncbi:MarR family winged helix-turn-helix transcriptional regulator [Amycolatopsis pithecellobii]|uniref:MarR family transcriptional regulator n=1 Tax=Amycolatopsis pithecellobii TaxID=664692 RepID=A0A6N7YI00_9PSEU|nr:MarR family winged helix-turn-helix transcriptional regulator [Amycolatopsis pithecellobii]MTD52527.1 MarR family transcriptional regulator [Amycolatopsis pithecellobii]
MQTQESPDDENVPVGVRPSVTSEITWLLHRAAQRLRAATGEQAEAHGIHLREYIILSALEINPNLTQIELGKSLGLDKTTLMHQLGQLERMGLIVRRTDPRDGRARIPRNTAAGSALRAQVAKSCERVEAAMLDGFSEDHVTMFRRMLFEIIGDSYDKGSCL